MPTFSPACLGIREGTFADRSEADNEDQGLGLKSRGFGGLGFRVLGVLGFKGLEFRVSRFRV